VAKEDNPPNCDVCASLMVMNLREFCYRCPNCGNSMGFPAMDDPRGKCSNHLIANGQAATRLCAICGLGPCGLHTNTAHPQLDPTKLSQVGVTYRHRESGGEYRYVCRATMEASGQDVIVYRSMTDNGARPFVRPTKEFCDGRFEEVK
jgi:hypothetical protein